MQSSTRILLVLPLFALAAACGGADNDAAPAASSQPAQSQPAQSQPATTASEPAMSRTPSPPGARVYFVTPADGDVVSSPVHLEFGIQGMAVEPAGTQAKNSGHHHVIVDTELPAMDAPIPADGQHIHFGDGSTSTDLELAPGKHTLQLLFADYRHVPHQPPVASERITITVE
ncbi:MAG TPA: DUF4399 domain-containing protein [Woeseiaceae bacterium]|nr:DUF4399 domain-containing protein [Woeseiaceae bacterium]